MWYLIIGEKPIVIIWSSIKNVILVCMKWWSQVKQNKSPPQTKFSEIFNTIYQRSFEFGRTIKVWVGPRLLIFLTDPRDVEIILSSHVHIDK